MMRAAVVAIALVLGAGSARADEPTWRYGASFGFGQSWVDGDGYSELDLTVQASRRLTGRWRAAGHLSRVSLTGDEASAIAEGARVGVGLERSFARWTEPGSAAAITGSVRAGLTRETLYWDRGRLDRDGGYLEVRGLVDFDLSGRPGGRLFGMGLAVRGYVTRTPARLVTGPVAAAGRGTGSDAGYDVGFVVAWEWTASR